MVPLLKMASTAATLCSSPLQRFIPLRSCFTKSKLRASSLHKNVNGGSQLLLPSLLIQFLSPVEESEETLDKNERVVLPANESSEKLLRIRRTLNSLIELYYDFAMEPLADKDLKRIKKEMDRIIGGNFPVLREQVSRDEAQRRTAAINEPYKMEILESIKKDTINVYHIVTAR